MTSFKTDRTILKMCKATSSLHMLQVKALASSAGDPCATLRKQLEAQCAVVDATQQLLQDVTDVKQVLEAQLAECEAGV